MRILVVGAGGREHALAWACMRSPFSERVFVAPGNGGTGGMARNVALAVDDVVGLVRFATGERIDLVVLGPEAAVAAGAGDALRHAGVAVFGPDRGAGQVESSKGFAKRLMRDAGIPTAAYEAFAEAGAARRWARERGGRVAVKADGLAQGKGVVMCASAEEADGAIDSMLVHRVFGPAGSTVIVEERLEGRELSVFGVTDGTRVIPLAPARDYKRARDGDQGPNTGGMGAYSPPLDATAELVDEVVNTVLQPAVAQLAAQGMEYRGVLYAGLMLTPEGIRTLEFNARFGDPETQVVLPRLESDLVPLLLAAARGDLGSHPDLSWSPRPSVGVVVAAPGYPESHESGAVIEGLTGMPPGVLVFHAGTRYEPGAGLVTSGGRVLTCVGSGDTVAAARLNALAGAGRIGFSGAFFRSDIAQEAASGS